MSNFADLQDKTALVVGGAGLLGRAFSQAMASAGMQVIIGDIAESAAIQEAEAINQHLDPLKPVSTLQIDITDTQSVERAANQVFGQYRSVDALINNAYPRNKNYGKKLEDVSYESFCENISLNLGGCFLTAKTFAQHFAKQGSGNIVNIGSIYGVVAPRFEIYKDTEMTMPVEYAVIKSGIIHLTKYLAKHYSGKGIRANSLSPGGILDGQPSDFLTAYQTYCTSKGMLDANDISGALLFLLSDASQFVNGQNLVVDDGFTL